MNSPRIDIFNKKLKLPISGWQVSLLHLPFGLHLGPGGVPLNRGRPKTTFAPWFLHHLQLRRHHPNLELESQHGNKHTLQEKHLLRRAPQDHLRGHRPQLHQGGRHVQPRRRPQRNVRSEKRGSLYSNISRRETVGVRRPSRKHPDSRVAVHGRAVQDRGSRCRSSLS